MSKSNQYVGLDVSLKETSICVIDDVGKVVWRGRTESTPEAIASAVKQHAPHAVRIGVESGQLSSCHQYLSANTSMAASRPGVPRSPSNVTATRGPTRRKMLKRLAITPGVDASLEGAAKPRALSHHSDWEPKRRTLVGARHQACSASSHATAPAPELLPHFRNGPLLSNAAGLQRIPSFALPRTGHE
jgi:hypothetical protein